MYTIVFRIYWTYVHLLEVLEKRYLFKGKILDWVKKWIANQRQRVVVDQVAGEWKSVPSGVFQGSAIGIIFAILFGDSIDQVVGKGRLNLFIDDNKYSVTIEDQEGVNELQETVDEISKWATIWGIQMNPDKGCYLVFGEFAEKRGVII